MTIDLKKTPKYVAKMAELSEKIANGATIDEQQELFANAFTTLGNEINDMAEEQLKNLFEERNKNSALSAEEINFFNSLVDNEGVKDPKIIPEEVMIRVFEDLKVEHPLLSVINFKNTGLRLKAILGETDGRAEWGAIYGDIKGQLTQAFDEVEFGMNKLTAFVVLPKDALKFSYSWLKQFIVEQIKEAIAVAVELSLVSGDGNNQLVGLIKDLSKPAASGKIVTYPTDKDPIADLTSIEPKTAPKLMAPIMKFLSFEQKRTNSKGEALPDKVHKIDGKVKFLVNPVDLWELEAKFTHLTDGGAYVMPFPYNIKLVESLACPTGKGILFVADRYDAFMAASSTIEEFDQTFAIEDLQLYTTKSYYYGKAKDNHATAVVTLGVGG